MRTIETKVYEYNELSDKAKTKAIDWFRELACSDSSWDEFIKEDFEAYLAACGFRNVESYFSGFGSQGDGACFDYKGLELEALLASNAECSEVYINIIKELKDAITSNDKIMSIIKDDNINLYTRSYTNSYATHYYHSRTRYTEIETDTNDSEELNDDQQEAVNLLEKAINTACLELSCAYYDVLEKEYDHQTSDEVIAENIIANEYTFLECGKRFG